ncbi:MAG TPA: VpsF family polysaccharide biosynthesis protein [Rhodopila sp.]|uniref:VpsF family polysaccharide biosynthesis protein n=1 Tax=Rhodopila sp. TaxID=2480087 RepID=UPI002D02168A|nr:VpsF family polysaccharide biosynthesis protein [Rhodopila sp.]HVY14998.1 VpsF family polysaccharide biosynthesis protein [Rhodopila sp.]
MKSLRTLSPMLPSDLRYRAGNARTRRAAYVIALSAIILEFAISGNTLEVMGIDYSSPGGNPLVKFHPGTYLIAIAAFMVLFLQRPAGVGIVRLFRQTPALAGFIGLILFCAFYSILNVGISGAATYVESYLVAGLLAIVIEPATDRQKRTLAWWIVAFVVLSIFISVGETITQTHLIPLKLGDTPDKPLPTDVDDFRGAGLFGHPLTAAVTTAMAVFMLLRMRMNGLVKGALFTLFIIGLLSFGGRAALLVTIVMLVIATGVVLMRGMIRRDLDPGFVGAIVAALVILPPILIMVLTSTDIGSRIVSHMYMDESADVRSLQWLILNHLNLHDVMFGVPMQRMEILKYQIGLGSDTTDIENFWLLMFLNLGTIGFIVFLIALALLLLHLGRTTAHPLGWMLLIAAVAIDSTSNSLGRKSVDLLFMTACMVAMTGFPRVAPRRAAAIWRLPGRAQVGLRTRLNTQPVHAKLAGLKS